MPLLVAQHLHLDVLGLFDVFFKENIPVAKGLERLALHQREIIAQLLLVLDLAQRRARRRRPRL